MAKISIQMLAVNNLEVLHFTNPFLHGKITSTENWAHYIDLHFTAVLFNLHVCLKLLFNFSDN